MICTGKLAYRDRLFLPMSSKYGRQTQLSFSSFVSGRVTWVCEGDTDPREGIKVRYLQ